MPKPSPSKKVGAFKGKSPAAPRPGNKPRVDLKSQTGVKTGSAKKKGPNPQKLFVPDPITRVYDRFILYLSKLPANKGYNPILEVMWSDLDRVLPLSFKTCHLTKDMRRTRYTEKLGAKFTPFHVLCKVDRSMNARDVTALKEKLRILACQSYTEDKSRTREAIFKILLKAVHSKQVAGTGMLYITYKLLTFPLTNYLPFHLSNTQLSTYRCTLT